MSSFQLLELANGVKVCVPLENVPGSNAKIELYGQEVFLLYSDFEEVLDMLLVTCTKGEDGVVVDGSVKVGEADTMKVA